MIYTKMIGEKQVFSACRTIQMNDGSWVSNPTQEQIAEAGWVEYIPPVVPPSPKTEPDYEEVVSAIKTMFSTSTEELSDEDALAVAALYPTWASKIGDTVDTNIRLWYNDDLYKVLQPHTVQENWTPDVSPSLYVKISIEEWPEWSQPVGSADAYSLGDKVSHNNNHWVSDVDANVWEPGVYGWTMQ